MTCRELNGCLADALAGDLALDVRIRCEGHLAQCRHCLEYALGYRETIRLVRATHHSSDDGDAGTLPETLVRAILELLGEHWVAFVIQRGYGGFLTTAGRTFRDVLLNLDRMHEKLSLHHPHLQLPTFWCTDLTADTLVLHYSSTRSGLAPLVMGIVRGLARMHHTRVEIEHRRRRARGAPHDEFRIRVF